MKEIVFVNVGGEKPCMVQCIFENADEAMGNFSFVIENFGDKDFSARFVPRDTGLIELRMKSPKKTDGHIKASNLKYNENDFYVFSQVPRNKQLFVVMF